jgi:hypothetical protein
MAHERPLTGDLHPLTPEQEGRLLLWLRMRVAGHTIGTMFREARLRLGLVGLLSVIFWLALFGLFFEAFTFIDSMHTEVISLLFNSFFSALMVMMVFSTGILMYGGLYTSEEAKLLLTCPLRADNIHSHKFQEAFWFSSWGFILLGSPMLIAYGLVRDAPWSYYAMLLPFMISFVVIPAALGSIICMLLVAGLPRLRIHAVTISITIVLLGAIWRVWSALNASEAATLTTTWFEETLSQLTLTEQVFLPSWWLSSGLLDAALRGETAEQTWASSLEAMKFLGLLVANALLANLLAGWVAQGTYRVGYSHLQSETPQRKRHAQLWLDELLARSGTRWGGGTAFIAGKGPPDFPSRCNPVVTVSDLFRTARPLLLQLAFVHLYLRLRLHHWLPQPRRCWPYSVDLYNPICFSIDQPGRKTFLDSRSASGASRSHCLVEISLCLWRWHSSLPRPDHAQRLDARHPQADTGDSSHLLHDALQRTLRHCRWTWSPHAQPAGIVTRKNCGGLWRHTQPGCQCLVYHCCCPAGCPAKPP